MSEKLISQAIKKAEVGLRRKYKILNSQDVIGAIIFLGAFIGIFTLWSFYFRFGANYQNCVMIILTISFLTSILHELEHDLIHNLYFRKNTLVQDVMFFFIWLAKLHGNPWFRREMHLKHHIVSGQTDDAEERLIGLGLPCGFERIAVSIHPFGSLIVTPSVAKDAKWLDVQKLNLTSAPVAFLFFGLNKLFIMYVFAMMVWGSDRYALYLPARHWIWIRAANVLLCLPNLLRQACLVLMSNCSHYYGDIPERSVLHQNQILDHPLFYPFQIMCANFGATHIVHHYVPGQPFYIREILYRTGVKEMLIANGVRYNDFGVVMRANRYYDGSVSGPVTTTSTETEIIKTVSANNTHIGSMVMWLGLCCMVGVVSYVVVDGWVTVCLGQRIFRKYVRRRTNKENK